MEPNLLPHLSFFSSPDDQTGNAVEQPFLPSASPSRWEPNALLTDAAISGVSSTVPPSLGFEPSAQSDTARLSNLSLNRPSVPGQSRPILPVRGVRSREGHERKRSKLSSDTSTFDSVDYWMDFDKDDTLVGISETEVPMEKAKGPQATRTRLADTKAPPDSTAASGRASNAVPDEAFWFDSPLDNANSGNEDEDFSSMNLTDQLSKIDSAPPSDVPQREGLYSTPLSWEKPQPGLRLDSLIGLNNEPLNEAEQRRLIQIAMNPGPRMGGLGANIDLGFGGPRSSGLGPTTYGPDLGMTTPSQATNPEPPSQPTIATSRPRGETPRPPPPKRQGSSTSSAGEKGKGKIQDKAKGGDRTAHNDIERKYRTNLKDKIEELRDAVPALQTIPEHGDEHDGQSSRTSKVSKGAVLTKATEYIQHLERKNKQIVVEHRELSRRLQAYEQLLSATAQPTFQMPSYSRTLFDPRGFC